MDNYMIALRNIEEALFNRGLPREPTYLADSFDVVHRATVKQIPVIPVDHKCAVCGGRIKIKDKFCRNCGQRLHEISGK